MPNTKSAIKELRKTKNRTLRNKALKVKAKNLVKSGLKKIQAGDKTDLMSSIRAAVQSVDKAVKNAVIKKNTASRTKSRLMKKAKLT